jgi:hypothetical protein
VLYRHELTFLRLLSDDIPDVVGAVAPEDLDQGLCAVDALFRETGRVFAVWQLRWFLAVADEIQGWGLVRLCKLECVGE